jgi:hypothetical protein
MTFSSRISVDSTCCFAARLTPATALIALALTACTGDKPASGDEDSDPQSGDTSGGSTPTGGTSTGGTSGGGSSGGGASGAGGSAGSGVSGGSGGSTAGTAGEGGSGGASGSAGTGGAGGTPGALITNPPGITFDVSGTPGIRIVSSNLTQDTSTSLVYVEWFLLVENAGTALACQLSLDASFLNASGTAVETFIAYANSEPYDGSLTLSIPCIAPGERGAFWTNDIPTAAIDLAGIRTAEIAFSIGPSSGAVPHPLAPLVTSSAVTEHSSLGAGYWSVSGSMTATGTIYNLGADAYMISSAGLVVGNETAFHLDTFLQGTTWAFETVAAYEGPQPTDHLLFNDFIEGAEMLELGLGAWATDERSVRSLRARDARTLVKERRELARSALAKR